MKNETMNNVMTSDRLVAQSLQAQVTVEGALYVAIGAAAMALRLYNLGGAPLSNAEAHEALSAWRYAMNTGTPLAPISASWFVLTSLVFTFFGASDFWARFVPALAGTALVFAPCAFRRELGRGAALIASALLAISPVLVMSSRTADGTTLSALSLWLIVIGWRWMRPTAAEENDRRGLFLAGTGLGLGLASGPRFLSAAATLSLALALMMIVRRSFLGKLREGGSRIAPHWQWLLLSAVVTFVLAAASLIGGPGLTAAGNAFPLWLRGWLPLGDPQPGYLIPLALFTYEPLLVAFGLGGLAFALFSGWRSETPAEWRTVVRLMSAAAIGALIFGLLYAGRTASDTLWAVFPLAMLAGKAIAETFSGDWFEGEWQIVGAQAAALFAMLTFAYFNLGAYARGIGAGAVTSVNLNFDPAPYLRLIIAGGVIVLAIFVTALFGAGWSQRSALRGAALAVGAATLVGTLGAGWGLTQLRAASPVELWTPVGTADNVRLLKQTIEDIANRSVGNEFDLGITVLNDPVWNDRDGLLGWEFRQFTKVKFVEALTGTVDSPVVITEAAVSDPTLGSSYIGQPFPIFGREQLQPPAPDKNVDWWLYRAGGVEYSRKVLWVRQDVQTLSSENGE